MTPLDLLAEVDRLTAELALRETVVRRLNDEVARLRGAITLACQQFNDDDTTADEIHKGLRAALEEKT